MDTVRDLGQVELWQLSLERSLARRGRFPRSSAELARLQPDRLLTDEEFMTEYAAYWKLRREAARRPMVPALGVGAGAVALLAVALPSVLGGRSAPGHVDQSAFRANVSRPTTDTLVHRVPRFSHVVTTAPAPRRPAPRPAPVPVTTHTTAPAPATTQTSAPAPAKTHTSAPSKPHASAPALTKTHPSAPAPAKTHPSAPAPAKTHTSPPAPVQQAAPDVRQPVKPAKTVSVTHRPAVHKAVVASPAHPGQEAHAPAATQRTAAIKHDNNGRSTRPAASVSGGYVNPMAHASLTPERIDQGVDYSGSGTLGAIGSGTVTYVGTANTGWPGDFIEYRLSSGPDAGRYVYYAEDVVPAQGLHVGESVSPGQAIVTVTGGIEVGWGAGIGTETYAASAGQWSTAMDSGNVATPSGKSFSALIASLGGPPGIVEG